MRQVKEVQEIFGFIAALRTMLDNYPELQRNEALLKLLSSDSPIGFLLNLCEICGWSKEDLLNWVSKILCGIEVLTSKGLEKITDGAGKAANSLDNKVTDGILDSIEYGVKALLLANIKNMFTCSINPFIPKDVIKYPKPNSQDETFINGKGIVIPLSTIDLFNVLQHSPSSVMGKGLYFDNEMVSNDFWKSTDFNVYLWYIINKSTKINDEELKTIWDNRVLRRKKLKNNDILRKNFFNIYKGNNTYIGTTSEDDEITSYERNTKKEDKKNAKDEKKILKKQYLLVEYNEVNPTLTVPNSLTIWLNGDRYRKKVKSKVGDIYINSTVFEFNYDYIFSLKLFDSKTIVANIVNSILGITRSTVAGVMDVKYSIEEEIIAGMVGNIVAKVMEEEDTVIDDSFFTFSNDQYDALVINAENKYHNNYQFGDVKGQIDDASRNEINSIINGLGNSATLNEEQTKIKNLLKDVSASTAAKNGEVVLNGKFSFGDNIIFDLLKESVTQIVLQVLSPKVMMLYALNSYFMGDIADGDFSNISIENFLKGLTNLIVSIVKMVLKMLIDELLKELLIQIKELLNAMLRIIILERLEYYIEIVKRLLSLIQMFYNAFKGGKKGDTIIDNVNYADIVPTESQGE